MSDDNRPNDNRYQGNNVVNNVSNATQNHEHSSNKGPVSEIDLFKKQLEKGIIEPEVDASEEPLQSSNKTLIIIACALVAIALFGLGYLIGMNAGLNNKDKCVDYMPVNTDTDKDKDEDEGIKEVDIDDKIKEIYDYYHTNKDGTVYTGFDNIEDLMYKEDKFKVSDIKAIPSNLAQKIYELGKTEVEEKQKTDEETNYAYLEKADGEEIIKKYLKEIFGDNLKYKASLFEEGCHKFLYEKDNERFLLDSQCGGTSINSYSYKLTKAEQDNKYLYLTEEVTYKEPEKEDVVNTYKWVLNKDENNNYHLLRVEKQAK